MGNTYVIQNHHIVPEIMNTKLNSAIVYVFLWTLVLLAGHYHH